MMLANLSLALQYVLLYAVLAVALGMSALYSGLETGIYVLNKIRLDLRAENGLHAAVRLRKMIQNFNNVVVVLVVGVNIGQYVVAFVVSTLFVLAGAGEQAEWYSLAVATPLLFILGESVPKNVSQRLGDAITYRLAWVLRWSSLVYNAMGLALAVRGFSWLLMKAARVKGAHRPLGHEGVATLVAEGQASGVLTHSQVVMADRVMHLSQVRLVNVMIPINKVVKAPSDITRAELLDFLRGQNYSRLPLLNEAGEVAGVLDLYDVALTDDGRPPLANATPPLVLDDTMNVTDALYQMQRARRTMAIVKSAQGKHVGIATIKDIVEQIVGELEAW